jgi:dTDP-4-amino-4,6-dideoxygalactose transaminase
MSWRDRRSSPPPQARRLDHPRLAAPKTDGVSDAWRVPLSDLLVDEEIVAAADEAVRSGWWSMGPRVEKLEHAFAEMCGTPHALAVANGTAALHIALLATGCGAGDEVILPSLNFVAAANVVRHVGAAPVFCDVLGTHDLNMDPADVEAAVGPATRAVIVLHYGGFPCDMTSIQAVADAHGLAVIEDAAHAPGSLWRGQPCGSLGAVGCFSFFSNKNLPVGEGGMVVTSDDDLAQRMRLLRSHGMTSLTWDRHRGHAYTYDVVTEGFNYRLDEVRAAMGLVQLDRLAARNEARGAIQARYRELLHGSENITMPFGSMEPGSTSAHHLAVAVMPPDVETNDVRETLRAERIQTSVHYPPIHRFSAYESQTRALPRTDDIATRIMTLPLYPHMTEAQVDEVANATLGAVRVAARRSS